MTVAISAHTNISDLAGPYPRFMRRKGSTNISSVYSKREPRTRCLPTAHFADSCLSRKSFGNADLGPTWGSPHPQAASRIFGARRFFELIFEPGNLRSVLIQFRLELNSLAI